MKAITLDTGGLKFQSSWPQPSPAADEILVRVVKAGICETDLQLSLGYMGFTGIPGHEFVGVVVSGKHQGKRVVCEINCSCHQCSTCRAGRPSHCPNRTVVGIDRRDGAFAEWITVPERNLHFLSDKISDDVAVLIEPLAAAFQITEQIRFDGSERIAILGDGRLAYFSANVLAANVVSGLVTVFGKHDEKLLRFREAHFDTQLIHAPSFEGVPEKCFDVVVDCTGSTSGLPLALKMVRPRGTVVLKTTVADNHQTSLATAVIDEVTILGSRCGPFAKACRALESDRFDFNGLITHRYTLSNVDSAFQTARDVDSFKVVFEISEESRASD